MKNSNKIRLLLLFSATLVIAVSCAKNNDSKPQDQNVDKRQVMSDQNGIESNAFSDENDPYTHIMRLEGNTITLYEITENGDVAIASVDIDTSYYPSEDIKELNQGIVAYSKEEGFKRLENYTN